MKEFYLSVIIPSYNETENLRRGVLEEIKNYLAKQKYTWEVIISDDGSTDKESINLAKDFCQGNPGFKLIESAHAGKHFAIWSGLETALGKLILFTDMDQSTPIRELEKLLPYFDKGFDVVIGSRGVQRKNFSALRLLASTVFREVRRAILLRDIVDTQAGFKALRGEAARRIFPLLEVIRSRGNKITGWKVTAFDVEMLVVAKRLGYKIVEVKVNWEDRDISVGKSRGLAKFIYESLDMLKEIIRVRFNELRGYYPR